MPIDGLLGIIAVMRLKELKEQNSKHKFMSAYHILELIEQIDLWKAIVDANRQQDLSATNK